MGYHVSCHLAFLAAILLVAGAAPLPANAAPAAIMVYSSPVEPTGEVVAAEVAGRPAFARRPYVSKPRHLLPYGGTTAALPAKRGPSRFLSLPANVPVTAAPSAAARNPIGFAGNHSADNVVANGFEVEPPDQGLAVYNNIVAEITNDVLRFFIAGTGGALTGPIALSTFFRDSNFCSDPQAFFDPSVGRWFFTAISSNSSLCHGGAGTFEGFDVAVSATSNPFGRYYVYHIPAKSDDIAGCVPLDCFPDYPKAGFDANGLYISADLFGDGGIGAFVAAATYVLPKARLMAGTAITPVRVLYPLGDSFVVQPSIPAPGEPFASAANGTEYLLEARNILDLSSNIRVWAISNTNNIIANPSSLRAFPVDVAAEAYGCAFPGCIGAVPAFEPDVIGPYCSSQLAISAPLLDAGYWAFQATVQKANGRLYAALPSGALDGTALPRDIVAWFAITPSVSNTGIPSAVITAQGYVVPGDGYSLLYPAFALNKTGAGILGFTIANISQSVPGGFPSTAFMQVGPAGPAGSIMIAGQGITSDDGFTGCNPSSPTYPVGRWGDYGAAVVDAATGRFYAANENISGARGTFSNWGTFVTRLP